MKYNLKDEYKRFVTEPDLIQFRDHILSKPDGAAKFDQYLAARVQLMNDQELVKEMDPNSSSYEAVNEVVNKRKRLVEESEEDLRSPLKVLEKVVNVKNMITLDPLEKAIDVVKGILSSPKEEESQPEESQKPSLWDVFWK